MADPHVISALRGKRAELSGELIAAEKRIVQLRADIENLDGAIRVFDPTAAPDKIRPILRRKKPTLIPRGQCSRAVLDTLRDAGWVWKQADRIWAHALTPESAMSTRINAERLYQEVRRMIRQEKGIEAGQEVPF